jgi:hypothetical protein
MDAQFQQTPAAVDAALLQPAGELTQPEVHGSRGALEGLIDTEKHVFAHWHYQFRRGGGRGRAQVGGKVGDGEIRFVADCGNNGDAR